MPIAYIALGSNLDDPVQQVRMAIDAITVIAGCRLIKSSSLYTTAPQGYTEQPDFINAVVKIETSLSPLALWQALQAIEQAQKRVRVFKNGPRTIDCDLLTYDTITMNTEALILPHPRMLERDFVMKPLLEIDPEWKPTH
jgi:2-amino-4-hydroxy-6-hydroxymethyldihydropteridine diphosphokinase